MTGVEIAIISLAATAVLTSIAGTTVSAVAAENQAQAQSDAAKSEAGIRKAEALQNARQMRKAHARALAEQRVGFGKSGVISSQGSALDVLAENAGEFELDALTKERFGHNAAAFLNAQGDSYQQQGKYAVAGVSLSGAADVTNVALGTVGSLSAVGSFDPGGTFGPGGKTTTQQKARTSLAVMEG